MKNHRFPTLLLFLILVFSAVSLLAGCNQDTPTGTADTDTAQVDLDLTQLSSTMVYSEVSNMMTTPGNYMGKTVRMKGLFSSFFSEETGKVYLSCVIPDATACCQQGIEFERAGNYAFPNDYPEVGTEITVTGTFTTYLENGYTYCQLSNAVLTASK